MYTLNRHTPKGYSFGIGISHNEYTITHGVINHSMYLVEELANIVALVLQNNGPSGSGASILYRCAGDSIANVQNELIKIITVVYKCIVSTNLNGLSLFVTNKHGTINMNAGRTASHIKEPQVCGLNQLTGHMVASGLILRY